MAFVCDSPLLCAKGRVSFFFPFFFLDQAIENASSKLFLRLIVPSPFIAMPRGGGDHFDRDEQQERSNAEAAGERASKRGVEDEQAPPSSSTSSTSTSPVISARRPLGARPLLMTPPPPVATLFRALASAGAILVDDDLRSRAANALRAGEERERERGKEKDPEFFSFFVF